VDDWPSFLFGAVIGGVLMLVLTLRRRRREAKRFDLVAPPAPAPEIPPEIRSAVLKLRAEGKLISAVKLLRERIDVDLKTAKDIVERMR
jgi:ribosomal protein L7/L12